MLLLIMWQQVKNEISLSKLECKVSPNTTTIWNPSRNQHFLPSLLLYLSCFRYLFTRSINICWAPVMCWVSIFSMSGKKFAMFLDFMFYPKVISIIDVALLTDAQDVTEFFAGLPLLRLRRVLVSPVLRFMLALQLSSALHLLLLCFCLPINVSLILCSRSVYCVRRLDYF